LLETENVHDTIFTTILPPYTALPHYVNWLDTQGYDK
jgi:hypothetical protein